jgi:hypothetical protein
MRFRPVNSRLIFIPSGVSALTLASIDRRLLNRTIGLLSLVFLLSADLSSADDAELYARILATAREFDATLPNFVCKQTTRRFTAKKDGSWKQQDWTEEELTYFQRQERTELLSIKGKRVPKDQRRRRRGFTTNSLFSGPFNLALGTKAKPQLELAPSPTAENKLLNFMVAKENSGWQVTGDGRKFLRAVKGTITIQSDTLQVIRIALEPIAEPGDPEWLGSIRQMVEYKLIEVSGLNQFLPARAESIMKSKGGDARRNVTEFSDFRRFTADSKILDDDH